jgi:benzodiazapine receptor
LTAEPKSSSLKKVLNLSLFAVNMLLSFLSSSGKLPGVSLAELSAEVGLQIQPKGWAFSIWGPIYTLLGVFAVYQALPDRTVSSKNKEFVYEKIGYLFAINQVCSFCWIFVYNFAEVWSFALGLLLIVGMLTTCLKILLLSLRETLNVVELISVRYCFSIYSGWVTAATILNVGQLLKKVGWDSADTTVVSYIILSVALLIYSAFTVLERNPLYGAVFIWVLAALNRENIDQDMIFFYIYLVVFAGCTVFCVAEKIQGKCERGLFYSGEK